MNLLLFKNSLWVASGATALAVIFGLATALAMSGARPLVRGFLLFCCILTLALPPFLVTNAWLHLLGPAGIWQAGVPFALLSPAGAALLLGLGLWPVTALLAWSAGQRLERGVLESDLGIRGWALLSRVLWPRVRGAVGLAGIIIFTLALNNFAIPAILQVKVLPTEAWIRFSTSFDTWSAVQASAPLIVAPIALVWLFRRRENPWPTLRRSTHSGFFRRQIGSGWHRSSLVITSCVLVLALALPLLDLLLTARTWAEAPAALRAAREAAVHSLWYAAGAATLVCCVGLLVAAASAWFAKRRLPLLTLLWLLFLLPGILLGVLTLNAVNRPSLGWLADGTLVVLLVLTTRFAALGASPLHIALRQVPSGLHDAARIDGLNFAQRLRHVYWPVTGPLVAMVWCVVYVLCLWEVETILLLYPPGGETLAIKVFNLLHYGHTAHVNTLCLLLLGLAAAPLVVGWAGRFLTLPRAAVMLSAVALAVSGCAPAAPGRGGGLQSQSLVEAEVIGTRGVGAGQLNKPRSLATDSEGNVYVTDLTGRVQKFSSAGEWILSWQMPETDLGKPKGMCRDRDGNIVVVEPHYQRVNHFSREGKLLRHWGRKGTGPGEFTLPRDVDAATNGNLYVTEYGAMERVQVFSAGGQFLFGFGSPGTGPGQFNRPEGIALDRKGNVYVADSCNHRIQVFTEKGDFLYSYGTAGQALGQLSYPYDISVDAFGNQFVCEFGNSRVQVFDAAGKPLEIVGRAGSGRGEFANPWALALDDRGNLFVADALNHRVQKLTRPSGRELLVTLP